MASKTSPKSQKKKNDTVTFRVGRLFTSGQYGNKYFARGEKVEVLPNQKEDYTFRGVSPDFAEQLKKMQFVE